MVTAKEQLAVDKFDSIMNQMNESRELLLKGNKDDSDDDDSDDGRDGILQQAIQLALEQGRGWKPGEKEAYLEMLLDDDYIPPIFANTVQEVEKSGLSEAFTTLIYDDENPTQLMNTFKKRGLDAFQNGKRNVMKNMQYYRDAINFWYEAYAWALKIVPIQEGDFAYAETDDPTYNEHELNVARAAICNNIALAHLQLGNWGLARDECNKALTHDATNVKTYYRLATAYEKLKDFEKAGDAIDDAFAIDKDNKDVIKLHKSLADKIHKARTQRQQRERARAERVAKVKAVWRHCSTSSNTTTDSIKGSRTSRILLGRVPLVSTVSDDVVNEDDHEEGEYQESRWHNHLPHTGLLPTKSVSDNVNWSWPCMFVYPSHNQSDFIQHFCENEVLAVRMAQVFPEMDDDEENSNQNATTSMSWDYRNEFTCSQLAVYFEVHTEAIETSRLLLNDKDHKIKSQKKIVQHPDTVELLHDQASCMRYYESSRALLGDEGTELANVVRELERTHLLQLRKRWKKKHKTLWCKPNPCPVVRIHPACTLYDILTDHRMVVPSFLVTLIMIPENNPMHETFLKEHKCIGLLEPKGS